MVKFDLGLDTMDEFAKIAFEKGWISKEAQGLTPRQQSHLRALMYRYHEGEQEALERAQRENPKLWQELAKPETPAEQPFVPQTPAWVTDPKGYEERSKEVAEMEKLKTEKPMGEEILSEIPGRMFDKYIDIFMGQGMTKEQAEAKAKQILNQTSDDMEAEAMSKEKNLLKVSAITSELVSLANDLDSMGERVAADAVDKQLNIFSSAADKLYDITGETGEKLISEVHPGGGPVQVPAKDEGGKVETIVEQQKKDIEVATKNPTGKYAETILRLVVTANRLEDEGNVEAAQMVDKAIEELRQAALPFVDRNLVIGATSSKDNKASKKQAGVAPWELAGLATPAAAKAVGVAGASGAGLAAAVALPVAVLGWGVFTGIKDALKGLVRRIGDLIGAINDVDDVSVVMIKQKLNPLLTKYKNDIYNAEKAMTKNATGQALVNYNRVLKTLQQDLKSGILQQNYNQFEDVLGMGPTRAGVTDKYANVWTELNSLIEKTDAAIGALTEEERKRAQSRTQSRETGTGSRQTTQTEKGKPASAEHTTLLKRYKGTLNSILTAMQKNEDRAGKALGGPRAYGKFMDALKRELSQINSKDNDYLEKMNDAVYNRLLAHLHRWKLAGSPLLIVKFAADEPNLADLIKGLPEPPKDATKPKGKATGRGSGRVVKDPQVEALQKALINAGFPLGRYGADGRWGPETAVAYNKFISDHPDVYIQHELASIPNPKAQRHENRPVAELQKATRIIQHLSGKEKETGVSIIPVGGINIDFDAAMTNPQNFVNYMQRTLNINAFSPGAALQYLGELESYVNENELNMEGRYPGTVKVWQERIANLTRTFQQFERQARGNPAFQYPWQPKQPGQVAGQTGQSGQAGQAGQSGKPEGENTIISAESLKTSDDIRRVINRLPPISMLTLDSFTQDLARGQGPEAEKKLYNRINSQLAEVSNALLRMRETASEDPYFQRIYHDARVYRAALANLRRSLRF